MTDHSMDDFYDMAICLLFQQAYSHILLMFLQEISTIIEYFGMFGF